ncbi:hypothetical protein [Caulobacter endophyticus]|uniref:hypothetical protein n=1 Tax=Caulobacter endophyticus TaxID=2172652 RepID=UPI0011B1E5B5|nr:hypothetical protein [Caulobacter endophyticus]
MLANAWDAAAHGLAGEADGADVVIATPRDLSRVGWRYWLDTPGDTLTVAGGEILPATQIGCVLTRLSGVSEADLPHIAGEDRAYVAAEMTAFLLALLAGFERPVVNRPTPSCLCGPHRSDAGWRRMAIELGLRAAPLSLTAACGQPREPEPDPNIVTVVGKTAFGAEGPAQAKAAVALARGADADLLTVAFASNDPGAILRAHPHVDLTDAGTALAVRDYCAHMAETAA